MSASDNSKKISNQSSWQKSESELAQSVSTEPTSDSNSRHKLIEQARKFLKNEDVVDADISKQVEFLKTKGLSEDELKGLINERKNLKIPTESATSKLSPKKVETIFQSEITDTEPSTSSMPPIITYPEFLTSPSPPSAPLLTFRSFLKLLYATSFLTAGIYGTVEYIVSPMLERLADCRHDFFSTTLLNLENLNQKLETVVSKVPTTTKTKSNIDSNSLDKEKEEDPAELFHRDVGIQTTLSCNSSGTDNDLATPTPLDCQISYYSDLHAHLKDLSSCLNSEITSDLGLDESFIGLREYLNTIVSQSPFLSGNNESKYRSNGMMLGYYSTRKTTGTNGELDEATKVKKEIKGMKGLLLSARTFPGLKAAILPK